MFPVSKSLETECRLRVQNEAERRQGQNYREPWDNYVKALRRPAEKRLPSYDMLVVRESGHNLCHWLCTVCGVGSTYSLQK